MAALLAVLLAASGAAGATDIFCNMGCDWEWDCQSHPREGCEWRGGGSGGAMAPPKDAYEKVREALETIGTVTGSGSGLGSFDYWVEIDGREYYLNVKPH